MAGGVNDVDLTVGADSSPAAAGLEALRNYGEKAQSELSSVFSRTIAVTGIIAAIDAVINKAHELHHEAERFGLDAEQLQTISNAAKEDGISLESVARAMNRLEIATGAALSGNQQMAAAFGALDISMLDFQNLNPQQKMLALADAVKKAGLNTETYDAVAKILGARFGTELIPLLLKGGAAMEAISKSAAIMSNDTTARLDAFYRIWKMVWNNIQVTAAEVLSPILTIYATTMEGMKGYTAEFKDYVVAGWKVIGRAMVLDWPGVEKEWKAGLDQMVSDAKIAKDKITAIYAGEGKPPAVTTATDIEDMPDASTRESARGGSRGGSSATSAEREESAVEKLQAKTRQYYLESLSAGEKLKELQKDRNALEDQLNQGRLDGNITDEESAKLQEQIADKDHEIDKTTDDLNKKRQDALDASEQQLSDEQEQTRELQAQKEGRSWEVDSMRQEYDYQQKIKTITEQINEAWAEGDQKTAETLTNLRDQLQTEKDITSEINKQNAAKQAEQNRLHAVQTGGGLPGMKGGTGIPTEGNAPLASATDEALVMATDPVTGKVNEALLTRNRAMAERAMLLGQPQPWSVVDVMARKAALQAIADRQLRDQAAKTRTSNLDEANWLSLIAEGRGNLVPSSAIAEHTDLGGLVSPDQWTNAMSWAQGTDIGAPGYGSPSLLAGGSFDPQVVNLLQAILAAVRPRAGAGMPIATLSGASAQQIVDALRSWLSGP